MLCVLVVEDSAAKADAIRSFLFEAVGDSTPLEVASADNLSEAVRRVSSAAFDLIVLDLMLPYIADGQADARAGLELLRLLRRNQGPNAGTAVIGMSAFPDELRDARDLFDGAGVLVVSFDDAGRWRDALRHTVADVVRRKTSRERVDFLILTALDEERAGFDGTELSTMAETIVAGLNVRRVELPVEGGRLRGGLVKLRQMGLAAATLDTSIALAAFDAHVVCMSGICAGFADRTRPGQLVIASPAWEYQAGKWSDDGFQIAPTQIPLPAGTRVILDQVAGSADFHRAIETGIARAVPRPSVWAEPTLAPAATGSAVIADSRRLQHIEAQHRKVAALDMETFGVYYAAHEVAPPVPHFFSVKCVVDMADADKGDDLHGYGCAASARATLFILRRLLDRSRDA